MTICSIGRVNAKSPIRCSECKTPWGAGPNAMHLGGGEWFVSWHQVCPCNSHGEVNARKRRERLEKSAKEQKG